MLAGDRLEEIRVRADTLGASQEQIAAVDEGEVQQRNEPLLRRGLEIDEEIAAADHVEPRERRIAEQALRREHDRLTQLLGHLIARGRP